MVGYNRRTATRVVHGRVKRKNRDRLSSPYSGPFDVYRARAPQGFRHVVTVGHVKRFLELIPEWRALSQDLQCVRLEMDWGCLGSYWFEGHIILCPWERDLAWDRCSMEFFLDHQTLISELDVPMKRVSDDEVSLAWTKWSARAFLLVHVLMHELGHHHDRITSPQRVDCPRGEAYAEEYAVTRQAQMLARYSDVFGWEVRSSRQSMI